MALLDKPNMEEVWASGGAAVKPSDQKIQTGWTAEVPPFQYENWVQGRQDQYLAHINQRGIPQWDGATEYEGGGLSYTQGSNGVVYKSVGPSGPSGTVQNPVTDSGGTYWEKAFTDNDDPRVANAVTNSRTITAGTGLSGGGTLAANRTLSVDFATAAQAQELTADDVAITPETLGDVLNSSGVWVTRAVGEEVWLDDSNPAVDIPPTASSLFRYIKLSAGENGSGGYNEGVLINESVSGSAPLIEATAEVNLPGSPFHGQTVRLLNTERRFVRAGESGVAQNDQMQRMTGDTNTNFAYRNGLSAEGVLSLGTNDGGQFAVGSVGLSRAIRFDSANSPNARTSETTDGETRPRNVGRTVYMRIL